MKMYGEKGSPSIISLKVQTSKYLNLPPINNDKNCKIGYTTHN